MPDGLTEAQRLKFRRHELVRRHELAQERQGLFPNPVNQRQLEELAAELGKIEERLRELGIRI